MNPDEFEQKLQRQALRRVPGEWRAEILSAAREVGSARRAVRGRLGEASLPGLHGWLSTFLWPHPQAWAGLAAIWILIFALDFSIRDKSPIAAEKTLPPSPEMVVQLRQQQRMLSELLGANDARVADRQNFLLQPRSERMEILAA